MNKEHESEQKERESFWATLPGKSTALIGFITAVAGMILACKQAGLLPKDFPQSLFSNSQSSSCLVTLGDGSSIDLERLCNYLQNQEFENANSETKKILFDITNFSSKKDRFEKGDSQKIDCQGLEVINELWRKNSDNKFGIGIQKNILLDVQQWSRFVNKVGWEKNGSLLDDRSQLNFSLNAPKGHLPGTLFWMTEDSNFYDGISCNLR